MLCLTTVYKDISQNMHFDVVLSEFIHPCSKSGGELNLVFAQSWRGCLSARTSYVRARVLDVCAENFSHSARLFRQQSQASFMLASCLRAVLISSPGTWVWTRMHALVVIHRRTLCENVDSAKIKVPFYTTDIIILHVAYIISIYRSISTNRYTPSKL